MPLAYEDEHLLVVDKPAGLVVHPGAGPLDRHARPRAARPDRRRRRPGAARDRPPARPRHVRADGRRADGAGVRAAAGDGARAASSSARYLALVKGRPRSRRGTIDAPIGRDRFEATRQSLDSDTPRDAVTHFEVVERLWTSTRCCGSRSRPGRMHQIRVHLAAIGLPVVGDPVYGVADDRLERQFLHAAGSPSPTRSRASGSSSSRRCPPICSGFSTRSARLAGYTSLLPRGEGRTVVPRSYAARFRPRPAGSAQPNRKGVAPWQSSP